MPHADWARADRDVERKATSRRMARQLLASRRVDLDERLRRSEVAARIIFGGSDAAAK